MPSTSVLRWVGGKVRHAPELTSVLNAADWVEGSRYVEPFVGGASVFFRVAPSKAMLGDANPALISFYQSVSSSADAVYQAAKGLEGKTSEIGFIERRREFNELESGIRKAALFLYLNRTCFNGVWRVNRLGHFNVPFGSRELRLPDIDTWRRMSAVLQRADIECADWAVTVGKVRKEDIVFIDPPYHQSDTTETFARYTKGVFSENDHRTLAARVKSLSEIGTQIVLTVSDSPLIRELYSEFKFSSLGGWYTVSARGSHLQSNEIVLRNFG